MKLMSIEQFQRDRFITGSAPSRRTLRGWIENGEINGVKRGKRYFVDIDIENKALGPQCLLISAPQYITARFVKGSRPDIRTVRQWIENNEIPGIRYGKLYFINVVSECWTTGDKLVDKALAA